MDCGKIIYHYLLDNSQENLGTYRKIRKIWQLKLEFGVKLFTLCKQNASKQPPPLQVIWEALGRTCRCGQGSHRSPRMTGGAWWDAEDSRSCRAHSCGLVLLGKTRAKAPSALFPRGKGRKEITILKSYPLSSAPHSRLHPLLQPMP